MFRLRRSQYCSHLQFKGVSWKLAWIPSLWIISTFRLNLRVYRLSLMLIYFAFIASLFKVYLILDYDRAYFLSQDIFVIDIQYRR